MGWVRLVGYERRWVSFAKEPYKRERHLANTLISPFATQSYTYHYTIVYTADIFTSCVAKNDGSLLQKSPIKEKGT